MKRKLALLAAPVLTLVVASVALATPGQKAAPPKLAPPPAGQFRVTGAVEKPLLLSVTQLAALPQVTMTVTFRNGNTPQTHTEGVNWITLTQAPVQAPKPTS
jgi:DMSO/TMAO reductase YedYZ molybdopterin-dependent catalytic subunit